MGILDNILNLFKLSNSEPIKFSEIKVPELKLPNLKDIGITSPKCPYCNAELAKFPARKTKCKNCGKYIYVRTRPLDRKKVLLKENELELLEEEWEKERYINERQNTPHKTNGQTSSSLVIDASSEMNAIIKDLTRNYKDYCNYDEILRINEKDRLPILQYIWSKWAFHGSSIEKDLKYTYPQYDFKDIRLITYKESDRLISIYKQQEAIKSFESVGKNCIWIQPFATFSSCEEENSKRKPYDSYIDYKDYREKTKYDKNLCLIYDVHKISDVWYHPKGHIDSYFFGVLTDKIKPQDLKYYKFWVNGEIKQLNEQEFLNWCKSYNIDYPLYDEEKPLLS